MRVAALRVRTGLLAWVFLGVALGCGSSTASPAPPDDTGVSGADTALTDTRTPDVTDDTDDVETADDGAPWDPGPYPSGPYGNGVGSVLADMTWEGFVNEKANAVSTTKPYVVTSMHAIRKSGRRYALVHLSDYG